MFLDKNTLKKKTVNIISKNMQHGTYSMNSPKYPYKPCTN